jgi:hypothetical protein
MEKNQKIKVKIVSKNFTKKEKYVIIFPPQKKKIKVEKKITDFFKNN